MHKLDKIQYSFRSEADAGLELQRSQGVQLPQMRCAVSWDQYERKFGVKKKYGLQLKSFTALLPLIFESFSYSYFVKTNIYFPDWPTTSSKSKGKEMLTFLLLS